MVGCENDDCSREWVCCLSFLSFFSTTDPPPSVLASTNLSPHSNPHTLSPLLKLSYSSFLPFLSSRPNSQLNFPTLSHTATQFTSPLPSTPQFHFPCVNLETAPEDKWYCPDCTILLGLNEKAQKKGNGHAGHRKRRKLFS